MRQCDLRWQTTRRPNSEYYRQPGRAALPCDQSYAPNASSVRHVRWRKLQRKKSHSAIGGVDWWILVGHQGRRSRQQRSWRSEAPWQWQNQWYEGCEVNNAYQFELAFATNSKHKIRCETQVNIVCQYILAMTDVHPPQDLGPYLVFNDLNVRGELRLTHVRSEDIGISTMKNLSLEIRGQGPQPILVILQCDVSVSGESSGLCNF